MIDSLKSTKSPRRRETKDGHQTKGRRLIDKY